eukprot:TRINITY_DN4346_c0_g1_i1.p1 TRINITY_DN4346_c0_g1~~TRINITY_DN4346_c0_g1_i1.p1  ORF type:complete len:781 (+),score=132.72 TRINITY_DN4346_c0_g1_i1:70-2343(+)
MFRSLLGGVTESAPISTSPPPPAPVSGIVSLLCGEKMEMSVSGCNAPKAHPHYFAEEDDWVPGCLYITNYRMIFVGTDAVLGYDIPLLKLRSVTKANLRPPEANACRLQFEAEDCCYLLTSFQPEDGSRKQVCTHLQSILNADHSKNWRETFFCFTHGPMTFPIPQYGSCVPTQLSSIDGWTLFNPDREFERQGALVNGWRITNLNQGHEFAPSYAEKLCIPQSVTDEVARKCGEFRRKKRIPILSFYHKKTKAALCRSSQPESGILGKRDQYDEEMVAAIANGNKFRIIDVRPRCNAEAQKLQGGGYEDECFYGTTVTFANIENIHAVRDVYNKLEALCVSLSGAKWLTLVDQSQWIDYILLILNVAKQCAALLESGTSILLHCSDGWDRTAQVNSLVQIMLDPEFRTLKGFGALIEREWVFSGHNFRSRSGYGSAKYASPIFLQFLDATYQLLVQFPQSFEFNSSLLILLAESLHSGRFGTFAVDSPFDIYTHSMKQTTTSIWSYVFKNAKRYGNAAYLPPSVTSTADNLNSIIPDTRPQGMHFWREYFLRFAGGMVVPKNPAATAEGTRWERVARELAGQYARSQNRLFEVAKKANVPTAAPTQLSSLGVFLVSQEDVSDEPLAKNQKHDAQNPPDPRDTEITKLRADNKLLSKEVSRLLELLSTKGDHREKSFSHGNHKPMDDIFPDGDCDEDDQSADNSNEQEDADFANFDDFWAEEADVHLESVHANLSFSSTAPIHRYAQHRDIAVPMPS